MKLIVLYVFYKLIEQVYFFLAKYQSGDPSNLKLQSYSKFIEKGS